MTGGWLGDIWSARIGAERAEFQVYGRSGLADPTSAERVAQLLVAGLRDGWTQSGMDEVPPVPPGNGKGPLPEWTGIDLEGALAGWRSPTRRAATTSPNLLCLHDRLNGLTTSISLAGGSERGLSYRVAGYDDPAGGEANVQLVLDELRACTSTDVRLATLPNGVHVATYDTGGPEPENAIWLAANGDRAGMVAVERAAGPMPPGVREDVAEALHEILHLPWGEGEVRRLTSRAPWKDPAHDLSGSDLGVDPAQLTAAADILESAAGSLADSAPACADARRRGLVRRGRHRPGLARRAVTGSRAGAVGSAEGRAPRPPTTPRPTRQCRAP